MNTELIKTKSINGIAEWGDIPLYSDYQVSSLGEVRKKDTGKPIHVRIASTGYPTVTIFSDRRGKFQPVEVHALMGRAFLGYIPKVGHTVLDHINEVKTDNYLYNLRIISNRENIARSVKNRTGYTGVFQRTETKFVAYVKYKKEVFYLGFYKTPFLAHEIYKSAIEFININPSKKAFRKWVEGTVVLSKLIT